MNFKKYLLEKVGGNGAYQTRLFSDEIIKRVSKKGNKVTRDDLHHAATSYVKDIDNIDLEYLETQCEKKGMTIVDK